MARRRSSPNRNRYKLKLKKGTIYSIATLLAFAVAGLIAISFIRRGLLLIRVNDVLVKYIGFIPSLFLPFPFITGGLMISKIKIWLREPHVFFGSLIIVAALTGLVHDGLAGLEIWENIAIFLSSIGAFFLLLMVLGIGILVMCNIPFEDVFTFLVNTTKKAADASSKLGDKKSALAKPIKLGGMPATAPALANKPFEVKGLGQSPAKATTSSAPTSPSPLSPTMPPSAAATPWTYPPSNLFADSLGGKADRGNVNNNAAIIEKTLEAFGITAKVVEVNLGPAVTQYALEVAIGTKLSKISALGSDLALALAAPTGQIRIEAPIPGRSLVGIELPNRTAEFVTVRKVLESEALKHHKSKLAVALGLDVSGEPIVADIARMPHVLIAGSTGSGKSVCINAFLASLLFRNSPQELNLILVDPKRVELTGYNNIPHLLTPVIVEPDKVLSALKWATVEMDRRYKLFAEVGVRNLEGYNELSGFQALPYIVIFIDELADIMLFAQAEVEDAITRIAQMARATGIHLVLATQRPSVDIITGLIKANIPTRIAFAVSSMIDSKVIIDGPGAEKLLGKGDMLYIPPDQAKPTRIQGAYISDKETKNLIEFIKKQGVAPHYTEEVLTMPISSKKGGRGSAFIAPSGEDRDTLFADALRVIVQNQNASASFLQRKMSIGYARAARILDELQQAGVVGPADGAKPRDILVNDAESFLSQSTGATSQTG